MPSIDPVILQLKADVDSYIANVSRAQKLTDQKLDAIERRGFAMGQNLKKGFSLAGAAAGAFVASIAVQKVIEVTKAGLEYASSLGEQAQQLGITTDALQEYRFAATQVGLSSEEMDQALSQLTRRIGEAASGGKAQAEAFRKLGVSLEDASGNALEAGEAIPKIADGLQKIASPAERAAILMDLFGRSGQKLEPLLAGGSAAVNGLRDAAHKLGAVLSPDLINRADETADKLAAVKTVLSAQIASVVAQNSGAILGLANALASLVTQLARAGEAYRQFAILNNQFAAGITLASPFASQAAKQAAVDRVRSDGLSEADRRLTERLNRNGLSLDKLVPKAKVAGGGFVGGASVPNAAKVGAAGPTGPTAAETAQRYEDQLAAITSRILSALEAAAQTADERAEIQLRALEFDRLAAKSEIEHDKNYTEAQKRDLLAANERLADRGREKIEFDRKVSIERDAADLAEEVYRGDLEFLRLQGDLADTQADRKRIAIELLELEERHQRSILDAIIASETAADADKRRAQIAIDNLSATAGAKRDSVSRANETETERYLRELNKTPGQINEAIDGIKIDGLEALNDGLVDAITGAKSLGAVFKNVANQIIADLLRIAIQQAVIRPLAEALFGGGSGGGGGLFGGIAKLFGSVGGGFGGNTPQGGTYRPARASGGYVAPGQTYRVNEGASPGRVEAFMSRDGGKIIPLGQMNALRAGGPQGGMSIVRLELSGDIDARIQRVSGPVAIEVVRASAPALIDASAKETLSRAGRPRV